jgi:cell division protein FtsA
MAKEQIHVGLEIGTTKICVVVSEGRPDGTISILGVGETPSRGVRKGEIVDFRTVADCVREALVDAEEKTNVDIRNIWVAITGSHLRSFNNRGVFNIPEDRDDIREEDLEQVEVNAKEVTLPPENSFLHTIIQSYHVDGNRNVTNPLGMVGSRLEADFHVIHGVTTRIQNTLRCIETLNVGIEDVVLSSLASAQIVLTQQQKDLGALVIDIGGGTTDFLVYQDGGVLHSGVLAVGGDHITNDISIGLRLPIARAELLKVREGAASPPSESRGGVITLKNDPGFLGSTIDRLALDTIIHLRIREIFELIRKDVESASEGILGVLGAGVMITGGCARLPGISSVASDVLGLDVHITNARDVGGMMQTFENPQYSTAIGLTKYAMAVSANIPEETPLERLGRGLRGIFRRRSR